MRARRNSRRTAPDLRRTAPDPGRAFLLRLALPVALALAAIPGFAARVAADDAAAGDASGAELSPRFRGGLDVTFSNHGDAALYNTLDYGHTPFDAYNLRLQMAARPSSAFDLDAEVRYSDAGGVRLYGAYGTWTPDRSRDLTLQVGKLPWAVGTWGPRSDGEHNPLIGVPLLYSFPTALKNDEIPPTADALLAAHRPVWYSGEYDSSGGEERGMRVITDSEWDVGATLRGSLRPLSFALGAVQGAPGAPAPGRDTNAGKSVLGRVSVSPAPALEVGVSGAFGAYLDDGVAGALPPGAHVTQYHQQLGMADAALLLGHLELRAEGAVNVWQTPTLGDLRVRGGYGEARFAFATRWYAAARGDLLRFSRVVDSTGRSLPWDHDLDRLEGGLGLRIERRASLKAIAQRTWDHDADENETYTYDLVALQFVLSF